MIMMMVIIIIIIIIILIIIKFSNRIIIIARIAERGAGEQVPQGNFVGPSRVLKY